MPTSSSGAAPHRRHRDAAATHPADVDGIVEQSTDEQSQRWTAVARQYTRADAVAFLEHIASEWKDREESATGPSRSPH